MLAHAGPTSCDRIATQPQAMLNVECLFGIHGASMPSITGVIEGIGAPSQSMSNKEQLPNERNKSINLAELRSSRTSDWPPPNLIYKPVFDWT